MRKEARILLEKAVDSLLLSIDHFNSPWDKGREEAVLILLDRAFELLLKAAIVHKGGRIREPRAKETIGFDKCVRKCLTDESVKCLTEDQALTIQMINSLRDAAQHYMLDISEQQLYLYAQAGVTLFDTLIHLLYEKNLNHYLPTRVLPISTSPPTNLANLIDLEFNEIRRLVAPGSRKRLEARAKVRTLAIIDASLSGIRSQPGESQLGKILTLVAAGKPWQEIFPGVASLELDTRGTGLKVSIQITRSQGEQVCLVPEGTPGATTIAVKRVNELSFYSLGLRDLATKLGLNQHKTLALVRNLKIQESDDFFKVIVIGKAQFKRYSPKALDRLVQAVEAAQHL